MGRERQLKVKITGDERDLARAFGKTGSDASKWGDRLKTFGKAAALGLAGAGIAAVKFGLDFVEAAEESVKVGKDTAAVIKSTGGAAKVTAGQVGKLAEQLSLKAGIDDELIQSGENVLLTFTNIRNEVGKGNDIFNQASAAALDLSVRMDGDLQGAIVQVGKALNDPIKGITALTRVGVTFTQQQKDQIKALVESGDLLGAQKVILGELTKEFGGAAEAQATASDKLKVAFGNISEEIGMVLLPYVNQFSDWLVAEGIPLIRDEFIPWLRDELLPAIQDLAHWIGEELFPKLKDTGRVIQEDVLPAVQRLTEALVALPSAVQLALASLGVLAKFGGFGVLAGAATIMGKVIATVFGFIGFAATMAFNLILRIAPFSHLATLAFIFRDQVVGAFKWIGEQGSRLFSNLRTWGSTAVNAIAGFFTALPGRVSYYIGRIGTLFKRAINEAYDWIKDKVNAIVEAIKSIPSKIGSLGGKIKDAIVGGIGNIDLTPGFDIPGVPFAAEGGIVTKPTLLVAGEAGSEAIIPLDGRHGMGSVTYNIAIDARGSLGLDSRALEKAVVSAIGSAGAKGRQITIRGRQL